MTGAALRSPDPDCERARRQRENLGMLLGIGGVAAFSLTLPITRFVVAEMSPLLVGRAVLAGLAAALILLLTGTRAPPRRLWARLALASAGVVLGFPILTLGAAALLLNERIDVTTIVFAAAVVLTVAIGRRMPVARA